MNIQSRHIALGAVILAALMVVAGTIYFGSLRPGYSHVSNTISELGEAGAPRAALVAFGFFLPVGLLVWLALWLVRHGAQDQYLSLGMIALGGLGAGYMVAAFFPCDPGGPLFGSWRTLIHNFAGFIDYEGTAIGFLLVGRHFVKEGRMFPAVVFLTAGVLVLLCLALLMIEAAFPVRGAVQRIAEIIQFGGVFYVCHLLSGKMSADATQPPTGISARNLG